MLADTIAAVATPPGRSAIALIRVSGGDVPAIGAKVLDPFHPSSARRLRRARLRHPRSGEPVDECLYAVFAAPHSYTGEPVLEISVHGGLLVSAEALAALLAAGCRQALPGEFTRRAVLNGKMDLLQAEATLDLIDATAPAARRQALYQLDRGLSEQLAALRSAVLEVEGLMAYEIDFPEEDEGPIPPERIAAAATAARDRLAALLATAPEGERLSEGALVVIAGRPNVGKSSLFNALLGRARAIVTEVPGTTRDAIEADAVLEGLPFRLVDTAGLRESAERVESLGIEVSRRYLQAADVVLFCVEAARASGADEERFVAETGDRSLVVRSKADLAEPERGEPASDGLRVSALTGEGLAELRRALAHRSFAALAEGADLAPMLTRQRHRQALEAAHAEMDAFLAARSAGREAVISATHLRAAVSSLDELIGVVHPEEVLERVFAEFCVGK